MTLADLYRDLAERMHHAAAEVKARNAGTRDHVRMTHDEEPHWVTINGTHVMIGADGMIVKGPHGLEGKPADHITHPSQMQPHPAPHHQAAHQEHQGKGPKPTTVKSKTAKAAVHELLSTGHEFSKEELMATAGVKTEKLFSDYIAMLKNPKYAGPAGALKIEKNANGHYYVAMADGKQAPPPPAGTFGPAPAATPAEPPAVKKPTKADKVAAAAPAPTPAPPPPAAPTEAEKALAAQPVSPYAEGVSAMMNAHPGSMGKAVADKHYESAMAASNIYLAHAVKKTDDQAEHAKAVLKWKEQKAAAMAAWAQAVHGHAVTPKKQELFLADHQLAKDIKADPLSSINKHVAAWKSNTAGEKMGTWPAKPAAAEEPGTLAKKYGFTPPDLSEHAQVPDMGKHTAVQAHEYANLVPDHHEAIGPADFTTEHGGWSKGISKIKGDLEKQSGINAQDNKKSVEHKLRARLKDKPNFQALLKRLGLAKEGHMSLESRLIQTWAGSSGDGNPLSVAMQLAVRDAFGIPDSHIEKKALTALNAHSDEAALFKQAIQGINPNIKPLQAHEVETAKHALQEFVQAQYDETQHMLKELGHDHVYLARGMKIVSKHSNADGAANVKLQPASSFSTNYGTANSFAGHGTVFMVKVPREQVLSTYLTGFGCTGEHEVVVLAHNKLKAFTVPAGMSQTSAASLVHSQVKGQAAAAPAPAAASKPPAAPTNAAPTMPAGDYHAKLAALKKAVINAKSKAYKAGKVAFATKNPHKVAHATKAAEEAAAAVKALTEFKMSGGKK